MSGWMYYPYKKCPDCEYFDWDESDWEVPSAAYDCSHEHKDCPEKGSEETGEDVWV